MHIKASPASLSSRIIANLSGIENEFRTKKEMDGVNSQTYAGGHHVETKNQCIKEILFLWILIVHIPTH